MRRPSPAGERAPARARGVVAASHGRQLLVRVDGESDLLRQAVARGRRSDCCVGDRVELTLIGDTQAAIESVEPRRNCLRRSDAGRTKLLAANIDQAAIVLAGEPLFSEELLVRVLAAAAVEQVSVLIIAGKTDVADAHARIEPRLRLYESLGYPVLRLSAKAQPQTSIETLQGSLAGRCTLLLGQSGMGKSTLVNLLIPEAEMATQAISEALSSGRHTTTFCRMFDRGTHLPAGAALIDSPGFQLFGLAHLSASQLMHALPDIAPWLGHCRFGNCQHRDEPGCAVRAAMDDGALDARRHALYLRMLEDTLQTGRPY